MRPPPDVSGVASICKTVKTYLAASIMTSYFDAGDNPLAAAGGYGAQPRAPIMGRVSGYVPAISRAGIAENIALLAFVLAMMAYTAQGFMAWMTWPIRPVLVMPLQVLFVGLAFVSLLCSSHTLNRVLKGFVCWPVVLAIVPLAITFWHDAFTPVANRLPYLRSLHTLTGLLVFVNSFVLCAREKSARRLLQAVLLIAMISGAIAVFEGITGSHMRWSTYARPTTRSQFEMGPVAAVGLGFTPVTFSYAMVTPCVMAIVFVLSRQKPYAYPGRVLTVLTAVTCTGGLFAAASRSGILGVFTGALAGWILMRPRWRRGMLLTIVVGTLLGITAGTSVVRHVLKGGLRKDARLYCTWATYGPIVLAHPFGLAEGLSDDERGAQALSTAEARLGLSVDSDVSARGLKIPPHNMFLTAGWTLGWVGSGSLLAIYTFSLWRSYRTARSADMPPTIRLLTIALLAGFLALIGHGSFHNDSLFMGEMRNWFYIGMLYAVPTHALMKAHTMRRTTLESQAH